MADGRSIERDAIPLINERRYLGRAWFFRDMTERKRVEAPALRMARYDVLTGLANRAVFVEALQHAIATAKRGEKGFAMTLSRPRPFQGRERHAGHPVGDELLKSVADRLRANTRETDTVARFGGDEFAIIVGRHQRRRRRGNPGGQAGVAFALPFSVHVGATSISAPASGSPPTAPRPPMRRRCCRTPMSRFIGPSQKVAAAIVSSPTAMDAEVQTRVTLGAELRVAIDEGQLFLLYQPQVAIDTGRITGVEALVRWRHPKRGRPGP